jgi:hypothetical protein
MREPVSPDLAGAFVEIRVAAGVCQPAARAAKFAPLPDRDTPARTHGTKRGRTGAPAILRHPPSNRLNLQWVQKTGGSGFGTPDSSPHSSDEKVELRSFPMLLGHDSDRRWSEIAVRREQQGTPASCIYQGLLEAHSVEKYSGYLPVQSVSCKIYETRILYHSA